MVRKPAYEELEQEVKELKKVAAEALTGQNCSI